MDDGGEIRLNFHLHDAQMTVFNDPTRFRVLVAGRRFGKTHLAITDACCAALDPANEKRKPVYLLAPTQPQARLLYWRPLIQELHPLIESTNVNEGFIHLNNGVMIGVKGADNPDALRGPGLYRAILDEFASMKPVVWEEIIRPALADVRGRALFIGTPSGRNHFYNLFQIGMIGEDPEWKSFHYHSTANPFLPQGEVEAARKSMSSIAFRQEFEASFETGGGQIFKRDWCRIKGEDIDGEYFVTIDPAGFSEVAKPTSLQRKTLDRFVICVCKCNEDEWRYEKIIFGRWGVKEAAKRVVDVLEEYEPVGFGMEKGALYRAVLPYIMDEARIRNVPVMCEPLSHENRNKIERITYALQGRMEHGKITFAPGDWNEEAFDEITNFPSRLVHDDIPDAMSYVAQLVQLRSFADLSELQEPYWKPQDAYVGY